MKLLLTSGGITNTSISDALVEMLGKPIPSANQELFLVLRGHAVFEVEGDVVEAPAGSLIFVRLGALVADTPTYPMLYLNPVCCESRCGRTREALDHLRHAIECRRSFANRHGTTPT